MLQPSGSHSAVNNESYARGFSQRLLFGSGTSPSLNVLGFSVCTPTQTPFLWISNAQIISESVLTQLIYCHVCHSTISALPNTQDHNSLTSIGPQPTMVSLITIVYLTVQTSCTWQPFPVGMASLILIFILSNLQHEMPFEDLTSPQRRLRHIFSPPCLISQETQLTISMMTSTGTLQTASLGLLSQLNLTVLSACKYL